jgi:predicted phage tail protein
MFQEVGRGMLLLGEGVNRTSVGVNCLLIGAGSALLLWGVSQVLHARQGKKKDD